MYKNPDWKWIITNSDTRFHFPIQTYYLHKISSFTLTRCIDMWDGTWSLSVQSNSKIQKWIMSRLSLNQTRYKTIKFAEGELEQFLDELDRMMEVLYGK